MEAERKRFAAIYVRRSRVVSGDQSLSAEVQRKICEQWAASNGYEVSAVFEDLDVSGGKDDRPALNKLRQSLPQYDAVIAAKLDRWARSVRDFSAFAEVCQAQGVALVAVKDNLDLSTPVGRFIATIIAALAEMELEMITERLRTGKAASRAAGRWQGGSPPFGFDLADKQLSVNPEEAQIIRDAVAKRSAGATWRELQIWFNSNVPSRRGGQWTRLGIRKVLTNPRLRGTVFQPAEYEVALDVCAPGAWHGHSTAPARLLSTVARCATCGTKLTAQRADVESSATYRCQNVKCDSRVSVSAQRLDEYVESEFLAVYGDRDQMVARPAADVNAERAADLKQRIRDIDNMQLSTLPEDEVLALLRERKSLAAEVEELAGRSRAHLIMTRTGWTYREAWQQATMDERRRMIVDALSGPLLVRRGEGPTRSRRIEDRIDEPFPVD